MSRELLHLTMAANVEYTENCYELCANHELIGPYCMYEMGIPYI